MTDCITQLATNIEGLPTGGALGVAVAVLPILLLPEILGIDSAISACQRNDLTQPAIREFSELTTRRPHHEQRDAGHHQSQDVFRTHRTPLIHLYP